MVISNVRFGCTFSWHNVPCTTSGCLVLENVIPDFLRRCSRCRVQAIDVVVASKQSEAVPCLNRLTPESSSSYQQASLAEQSMMAVFRSHTFLTEFHIDAYRHRVYAMVVRLVCSYVMF